MVVNGVEQPQRYCGNDPTNRNGGRTGKNFRCKFHGGIESQSYAAVASNALKHGVYSKFLRGTLAPELQELWDKTPRNTDLSNEVHLARMRVAKFQHMLATGTTVVQGSINHATGEQRYHDVEDLLERALKQVESLSRSQQDMHPEQGASGDLRINVSVDVGNADIVDDDVPDLDADGVAHDETVPVASPEPVEEQTSLADELGDDP